jgi:hypothetical protein
MNDTTVFIPTQPLNTAVLFLIFNRLDTTQQVFEIIKQVKPPRLYIAADGARESRTGEQEKVKAVKEYVMTNIDWQCDVKTLFREKNLGCKYAVSSAIDWFFSQEEMGIILEDDCLPSQSFFWFCEQLLLKYKDDMRIWQISGDNFQNGIKRGDADYYFSTYNHIWGWASWSSRWHYYDVEMKSFAQFEQQNQIENIMANKKMQHYWLKQFKNTFMEKIDTWDYQWTYTIWINAGMSILPNINLISNIGFNEDATHTTQENSLVANLNTGELIFPLIHPVFYRIQKEADSYSEKTVFSNNTIFLRAVKKVYNVVTKLWK